MKTVKVNGPEGGGLAQLPHEAELKTGDIVSPKSRFGVGDLIKFQYRPSGLDDCRESYSKIREVMPKLEQDRNERGYFGPYRLKVHFLTENNKFISEADILELEKKA